MPPSPGRREFTVAQVATMCGVSPITVRAWIRRGHISRTPAGKIDAAALIGYLDHRGDRGRHTPGPD